MTLDKRTGGIIVRVQPWAWVMSAALATTLAGCGSAQPATGGETSAFPKLAASSPNISAIDFLTTRVGFAGVNHSLLETTNGGLSWQIHPLPHHDGLIRLDFLTAHVGWALTQGGTGAHPLLSLLRTTNGGETWTVERNFATDVSGSLAMTTATRGYVVVGSHLYGMSAAHRKGVMVPLPQGSVPQRLDFLTSRIGWVSVKQGSHYELLATTDGAKHFQLVFDSPAPIVAISFPTTQDGHILLGKSPGTPKLGSLEVTHDGGRVWTRQVSAQAFLRKGATGFPIALSFKGTRDGWLGTTSGALGVPASGLLVTTDGGAHWTSTGSGGHWNLGAQSMTSSGTGWAASVANNNALLFTKDNGRHWIQKWPALSPLKTDFVSAQRGYGLGTAIDSGAILATHNGGRSWRLVNAHPPATFSAMSFWGSEGFAVQAGTNSHGTYRAQVFHTSDGGRSWTKVFSHPSFTAGITMVGPQQAILRTSSAVYTTSDGGTQWTRSRHAITNKPGQTASYLSRQERVVYTPGHGWGTPATLTWVHDHRQSLMHTWTASSHTLYQMSSVDFLNRQVGWVLLQKLVRTRQTFQKPGSTKIFHKIRIVNELQSTTDGGTHWTVTTLPSRLSFNRHALDFLNGHVGFMDTNGAVLRTLNGGRRWTLMSTSAPNIP